MTTPFTRDLQKAVEFEVAQANGRIAKARQLVSRKRREYEAVMDYHSKQWCLHRFNGNRIAASQSLRQYERAHALWEQLSEEENAI